MRGLDTRSTRTWAAALLLAVTAAACGGGDPEAEPVGVGAAATGPPTSAEPAPTTTTPATQIASTELPSTAVSGGRDDGVLTIGTLLPETGPGNQIGIPAINAVNVGIREINDRGGVFGQPVRWVSADEGETLEDARTGIDTLMGSNVDAIIGPASSTVALNVLDDLMKAGVLVCSPTATAIALNDFPNRELFFRTVPSDSLSAQAMAEVAKGTGVDNYAVVYLDDQYGRPFAREAIRRLDGPEVAELYERAIPTDATPEDFAEIATELAERAPRTILLIADSARGWQMLQAMSPLFAAEPPSIIVNDAMRNPPNREVVAGLDAAVRDQIQGVSPVVPPGRGEPVGPYATNALDCLNLIALAAVEAETDDPQAIAAEMVDVSLVGALCHNFAVCRNRADDNRNLNYQGPNSIDFSPRGDPVRGRLGMFQFDASGLDVSTGGFLQITEQNE
jgi:branched-chain amino acid transport system substrate-binding protein